MFLQISFYHFFCCSCLLSAAAEAPIFCDTWQFNHDAGGTSGNCRKCQGDRGRCRTFLKTVAAPEKKVIAPHREVHGFPTKGKYGPDLWQTSLTNVLPPFRRQFFPAATSPLLLSFLSVGFVRLAQLLLAHILLILSAQIMSTCFSGNHIHCQVSLGNLEFHTFYVTM